MFKKYTEWRQCAGMSRRTCGATIKSTCIPMECVAFVWGGGYHWILETLHNQLGRVVGRGEGVSTSVCACVYVRACACPGADASDPV